MRIRIGEQVFDDSSVPMMVELTDADKRNIANMLPECFMYAVFPDDFGTREKMFNWMNFKDANFK